MSCEIVVLYGGFEVSTACTVQEDILKWTQWNEYETGNGLVRLGGFSVDAPRTGWGVLLVGWCWLVKNAGSWYERHVKQVEPSWGKGIYIYIHEVILK